MCIFIWCVVRCRCCAHFRPISCAISRPFPNIHPSHVALLFNPNHRLSAFARNSKLTLLRHRHCCPFCRCFSFIRSYSARYPISCLLPLFRLQSWFCSCCSYIRCSSTRHFAFVRPMFSDLSLRITQSRRNAQLNWLTFVWTPACCRC